MSQNKNRLCHKRHKEGGGVLGAINRTNHPKSLSFSARALWLCVCIRSHTEFSGKENEGTGKEGLFFLLFPGSTGIWRD